jgi:hypothetical protein
MPTALNKQNEYDVPLVMLALAITIGIAWHGWRQDHRRNPPIRTSGQRILGLQARLAQLKCWRQQMGSVNYRIKSCQIIKTRTLPPCNSIRQT